MDKARIFELDLLRAISAFAVVWLHVSSQYWYYTFPSSTWDISNIFDSMSRWSVPVFVLISGSLFLGKEELSMKGLFKKNIFRLVVVYVVWSTLYSLLLNNCRCFDLFAFLKSLCYGPDHLWFLKMLLGIYIVIPILRSVVKDKRIACYYVVLSVIFSFLLSGLDEVSSCIGDFICQMDVRIATVFSGYFVLGHVLHTTSFRPKVRGLFYSLGILAVFLVILLTFLSSHNQGLPDGKYYDYDNLFTLLESVAVFVLFTKEEKIVMFFRSFFRPYIEKISEYSLGIYVLHFIFVIIIFRLRLISFSFNPLLFIPIYSCIIFMISYFVTMLLAKIPIMKYCLT